MKKGKTPGPDGISLEFYLIFYNNIKHLLLDALNYTYLQADHDPILFNGVITLCFKKGNPADIQNYRPISLLDVDYKLLNKILNERLKNSLNHLISPLQRHYNHTASITLRDINYLAQRSTTASYLIRLDFKKAFDSIEYNWLNLVLQHQKFPHTFRKYITQIQYHAASQIKVNKSITDSIPINKGVRQGDPLSPTLFLLALNPLITHIQANNSISPVPNPTKNPPKLTAYADDITLTISNPLSLKEALKTITLFQKASGLKLNPTKTTGVAINKRLDITTDYNIQWHPDCINPLNITIDSPPAIMSTWNRNIKTLQKTATNLSHPYATYDLKSTLTKLSCPLIFPILPITTPYPKQKLNKSTA